MLVTGGCNSNLAGGSGISAFIECQIPVDSAKSDNNPKPAQCKPYCLLGCGFGFEMKSFKSKLIASSIIIVGKLRKQTQ